MAIDEIERFRLLNVASFFWFTFACGMGVSSCFHYQKIVFILAFGGAILTLIPPTLAYCGHKSYSKVAFVLTYSMACIVVAYFVGKESLFEWGMLILPSSAYLLSNRTRPIWYYLLFGFVGVSFIFLIYAYTQPVIARIDIPYYSYLFTLTMGIFVFFMIVSFKKELARNMKIILHQNKELSQNQEIIHNQNTELLLANQALDRHQLALQKLNNDLQQFASLASHDMKEPLRTISAFSKILSRKMGENEDNRALFNFIEDAAKRMNNLLEALLQYAHAGQDEKEREMVDLNMILNQVRMDYFEAIEQKKACINFTYLPIIRAHPEFCKQLFQNLIGNSIKYTAPNVTPSIKIRFEKNPNFLKITFQDNGIGISQKDLENIFKPFTRLHSVMEFEGSGIGLATCQRIVENYGGTISVESVLGEGSIFTVLLPLEMLIETDSEISELRQGTAKTPVSAAFQLN